MNNNTETTILKEVNRDFDESGKLTSMTEKSVTREKVKEPDFVKLYFKDLLMLVGLPKGRSSILFHLLKRIDWNNEIILNSTIKRTIAKKVAVELKEKTTIRTIDQALHGFTRKKILLRKGTGVYIPNPKIFARGQWENIKQLRITVIYDENGKVITSDSVEK